MIVGGLGPSEVVEGNYWFFELWFTRSGNIDKKKSEDIQPVIVKWEPMVDMYEVLDQKGLFLARDFMFDGSEPRYLTKTREEAVRLWNELVEEEIKRVGNKNRRVQNLQSLRKGD